MITVQEHDNIADLLHKFSVNDLDSVFESFGGEGTGVVVEDEASLL
ncbi:hypothetical protein AGMMS49531_07540 [Endomicrobiia bacterium]|nr:hypothetical protein AGMMS49531_07540 [Endomicrobiia bacterium]